MYLNINWQKPNHVVGLKSEFQNSIYEKNQIGLTFSGSTPMSSQNFSMPSGPTTSSQPVFDRHVWSTDARLASRDRLAISITHLHIHRTTPSIFYWKTSPRVFVSYHVFWKCWRWNEMLRRVLGAMLNLQLYFRRLIISPRRDQCQFTDMVSI